MTVEAISQVFALAKPLLHERFRRLFAAMLAHSFGLGGVSLVAQATGVARSTIERGLTELEELSAQGKEIGSHIRRRGAGRKSALDDATFMDHLRGLVDPITRGDPESPLLWVSKSTRHLAAALRELGHTESYETVRQALHALEFTLQGNQKRKEGAQHPDRNAQFEFLAARAKKFLVAAQPVISVDTKKKELVGDFKNGGQEWQPKGEPEAVRVHDFPDKTLGKAAPYGVYDVGADEGWVSVGISSDTAEFAVATIRTWWERMGSQRYPDARHLMITADGGGSNSARGKLWKTCLQGLADELGLRLWVSHYPPGTSKWNKIEHRMFSRITQNWRSRPLLSIEVIVSLIANTRMKGGKTLQAELDPRIYEKGKQVSQEEFDDVRLLLQEFHGDWNYVIIPRDEWPNWPSEHAAVTS
jgi:hypothetical protein